MSRWPFITKLLQCIGRQEYIRFGLRDRLIRLFHNPDVYFNKPFEVGFFGKKYSGNFDTFIDWCVYYFGAYSKSELKLFQDLVPLSNNKPIFIDIGANIGHHTLFVSSIAYNVHSFEPFPFVSQKIRQKIQDNNIQNVFLHQVGLGSKNEIKDFYPPPTCNTGTGSFIAGWNESNEVVKLQIKIGDEYFKKHGILKVDFIKIDVEGFEIEVIRGLKKTIQSHMPICFFEWNQNKLKSGFKNGKELFPETYNFYIFMDSQKTLGIFQKADYGLAKMGDLWPNGNVLALPSHIALPAFITRLN